MIWASNILKKKARGGVAQITKAFCNEWAEKGINVNSLAPGYMATEMNTALLDPSNPRKEAITNRIPAKKWGTPEDMKDLAYFWHRKHRITLTEQLFR